jgi:hypothetical protein
MAPRIELTQAEADRIRSEIIDFNLAAVARALGVPPGVAIRAAARLPLLARDAAQIRSRIDHVIQPLRVILESLPDDGGGPRPKARSSARRAP